MAITTLLVCEVTRQRLGDCGLADLAACLWPADCQSCGRFLGDDPPVVVVDDLKTVAVASLHHQRCRLPGWNDSGVVAVASGRYTTFVVRMVLLPAARAGGVKGTCPVMLVNPGLECVQLEHVPGGGWRVGHGEWLARAGLVGSRWELASGARGDGLLARVTDSSVAVVLQVPPFTVYEAPADQRLLDRARALGGVLVAVTPTLNPGDFAAGELSAALADRRTLAGWAGLHGTRRLPRSGFRLRPQACVLHWNSDKLSVGTLVRRAPRRLTAEQARTWAEGVISAGQGEPVTWRPAREGRPAEGWQARGLYSRQQHVLRRHPDGWKLVLICGQAAGRAAETGNEAKAWAADVLRLHAGISYVTWRPVPSALGSATWYGRA